MMKAYFKAIILSLKIYKNIQKLYFLMGGGGVGGAGGGSVLDILTVYANTLERSFIDVKVP